MNGSTCCAESAGLSVTGLKLPGLPGTSGGVLPGGTPGGTLLDKLAAAFDAAVHGDGVGSGNSTGGGNGSANVIDFPMVNPYKPIIKTRSPVAGLTAFPSPIVNFSRNRRSDFSNSYVNFTAKGERDASADGMPDGADSLGFISPSDGIPDGVSLSNSGPSNLQLILNSINAGLATVPAILSARKKQPYYDPNQGGQYGTSEGGYATGNAGGQIGSQVGGAVGNVGDTLGNIVAQHPYLVLAGGAALVLMFMNPPRRR